MEILIVKTSAIGDVTHTLPALNALRKKYPEARIAWLVEEAAAEVVIGHKALDRVLVSRRKRWSRDIFGAKCFSVLGEVRSFIKKLRDTRYDLLIDFQGLLKSGIFVALARADRKVGYGKGMDHAEGSWIFLNERIPAVDMNIHALDRELMLLKAIGIECGEVRFDFPVSERDKKVVAGLLKEHRVDQEKPIVALNPMATWPTKLWDNQKFAQVADKLNERGIEIIFTGSQTDRASIDEIIKSMKQAVPNLAGKTRLKELAVLYELAAMLITTDTGPMHIAAAVGTPVVAIFGSTAPWRTGPYGDSHLIVSAEKDCSPCLKKDCQKNMECMGDISVDMVVSAVDEILARSQ